MTLSLGKDHPWCVCLRPDVAGVGKGNSRAKAEITRRQELSDNNEGVNVKEVFSPDPGDIDLLEADRIVAGGRGLNGAEGFQLLEGLANQLEAGVGATRVAVDLGWVPYSRQIGQTGKAVKPRLYIALGISGASQHVDGMSGSEVIIAINNDPNAHIFKLCHLGFVGEAEPIMQALMKALDPKLESSELVAASKGK
ncbi:electron transfer flavoprotein subunit alpha/FixB family protein [Salicibibacter cibarius]|uniref:Electron transfer flavoprotein subunit alpha/FixB family protein n=2 Tax=Salicibibacter cibarius TaxID=2743000 RepID=A0A7T7CDV1_9BACI|nr:electron transfer flavoprotein subunit alpha/FixB family protein [Salicibibacter cibarius]